ncbi:hypothetical protein SCLCIDRAFT_34798 [Scleroderma citrinum Foug A]|uniref:XPG-I domain-containing protein n=1 Tax=Scleroderma citrinum Foug A TaxID=1036808 RepID=A0A0C3D1J5_9AGAM|nr:hypothetical protein SCLCIDRAFT_34798 [Scleroderma citrinum Foug A]
MLSEIAFKTFESSGNEADGRLLTVGFNARATTSTWVSFLTNVFTWHHASTGKSHEMPMIFTWLSEISRMPVHPYFIFDGPNCPRLNGGDECIYGTGPCLLVECFQELLNAFSFSWHTAPGEAEAELACFQLHGLVDVVVTPYNDMLLFGASNVIQSGADYDSGLLGFTVEITHQLTQYGLGRSLLSAVKRLRFAEFMEFHAKWRRQLCDVLERDPQHRLG